jgi:tetratricopeptide (TPR) repeat protein
MLFGTFRYRLCASFALGLSLAFSAAAFAQAPAPAPAWPLDGPAFSSSAEDIQKAAAKIVPEKFMSATILFERTAYVLDDSGRLSYRHSMIYRIETEAAVRGWAETSVRWEAWYQKQPEIHARVIQQDGKVSELDQKTVTDGPASAQDDGTYSDARIRKAPLPGLAIGAIVEEEQLLEDKTPFFAGGGIYRAYLQHNVPVMRSEILIEAPKSLKLEYRIHLLPQIVATNEDQGTVRHLKFDQGYLPAWVNSDISLSTHVLLNPMVEFSTGESWAAVANAYRQLAEPQIDPASVKDFMPQGVTTAPTGADRLATIQTIVSRLHKEIRYTGIEFGQAALQPQPATEVIKRHYGDCKDKAALLVAMLRAAGIKAYLALLDPGYGPDVTPDLPGMNLFDHAITYVPADGKGGEAIWIDATAEYAQVGTLPAMDTARLALVIAEGTTSLTLIPVPKPEDDVLTEQHDVVMAENGPAHITESSQTHGPIDQSYRSGYGGAATKESTEGLEKYAKSVYLAKSLTGVDHGDGKDFTKPFFLKLDMAEAKRANSDIDDAAVAIPFYWVWSRLPPWFRTDPKPDSEKLTAQQEEDQKRAIAARTTEYEVHPFITEWRYKITPPEGFLLRTLPEDKTTQMGPAKLTQHYESDPNGVVTAVLRFSTVKPRYTVDEALALRDAVLAGYKQDMVMVLFDQAGAKLLAAGKTREALSADQALIDHHPAEALHHVQMAYALLEAGLGDRARTEAEKAIKLDAKSAVSYRVLGWVCQFDAIGRQFGHGFDWDCAEKALAKAKELDPEDNNTRVNLALINEYDHRGERYSEDAPLKDAAREYRDLKEKDKNVGDQYEDNLLFTLLYGGQYKDLLDELAKLSTSQRREAMGIAATVALNGTKAGLERADHLPAGAQGRSAALASAGSQLLQMRLYGPATEMLAAGVEGQSDAAATTQQIDLFKHLAKWKGDYLPATNPASVVQRLMIAFFTGTLTDSLANQLLSRHAYAGDDEWKRSLEKAGELSGMVHSLAGQMDLTDSVVLDLLAGSMKFTSDGDDKTGYRISMESLGSQTQQFFVSKEEGGFRVVTDASTSATIGNEVLYLLGKGKDDEARSLLDWARDQMHKGGGDDPLSGPELPSFWTTGESSGRPAMELAAASLLDDTPEVKDLLPKVREASEKSTTDESRTALALVLASGYVALQMGPEAQAASTEILKKYPNSYVALGEAGEAYALQKNWADWDALLEAQLKKHPKDDTLMRMKTQLAEYQSNFELARTWVQKVIDTGKATEGDYNNMAWLALFDGKVDEKSVQAAQKSDMLSKNSSFAVLHTLACIYAFQGKTKEARELLLKAMTAAAMADPDSSIWYGFGAIDEQYGLPEAAIEAYKRVEKPTGQVHPTDTWVLADRRLKALGAAQK